MPFCEGFDAFCFLGFSALGLRVSLLDFFWLLAMTRLRRAHCPEPALRALPPDSEHGWTLPEALPGDTPPANREVNE